MATRDDHTATLEKRRLELTLVADDSATPEDVTRALTAWLARGPRHTAALVTPSAALAAAVKRAARRVDGGRRAGELTSVVVWDLAAAARFVAAGGPLLLALRLAEPKYFVELLRTATGTVERRAA